MTRLLLVPILLVPILWVWPQRGITATYYPNTKWVRPALVRVQRQINLESLTSDSASLPQQNFTVEWSGWLRTDRDGQYAVATRSDDRSILEIDDRVVLDNGGGTSSITLAMGPGLHQVRLRFLQTDGIYELYAYWTPPGATSQAPLPVQHLFVRHAPAVVVFLTRHVLFLWALCWLALALVAAARLAKRRREIAVGLPRLALHVTMVLASVVAALVVAEMMIRIGHSLREDRRPLDEQLRSSRARMANHDQICAHGAKRVTGVEKRFSFFDTRSAGEHDRHLVYRLLPDEEERGRHAAEDRLDLGSGQSYLFCMPFVRGRRIGRPPVAGDDADGNLALALTE